jgi:hypothetical protein
MARGVAVGIDGICIVFGRFGSGSVVLETSAGRLVGMVGTVGVAVIRVFFGSGFMDVAIGFGGPKSEIGCPSERWGKFTGGFLDPMADAVMLALDVTSRVSIEAGSL